MKPKARIPSLLSILALAGWLLAGCGDLKTEFYVNAPPPQGQRIEAWIVQAPNSSKIVTVGYRWTAPIGYSAVRIVAWERGGDDWNRFDSLSIPFRVDHSSPAGSDSGSFALRQNDIYLSETLVLGLAIPLENSTWLVVDSTPPLALAGTR